MKNYIARWRAVSKRLRDGGVTWREMWVPEKQDMKGEWWMAGLLFFSLLSYLGGSGAAFWMVWMVVAMQTYFSMMHRQSVRHRDTLLEKYGILADEQTTVIGRQRDQILAYRLRDDMEGDGWKGGSPSLN